MSDKIQKIIVVDYCDNCPYEGTCKAWKALTRAQRVKLTIGVGVGRFILKGCPLPDKSQQPIQWISTADQEPTPDRNILICDFDGNISTGYLCLETKKYRPDCQDLKLNLLRGETIAYWAEIQTPKDL